MFVTAHRKDLEIAAKAEMGKKKKKKKKSPVVSVPALMFSSILPLYGYHVWDHFQSSLTFVNHTEPCD